jgi:hypothetical protein
MRNTKDADNTDEVLPGEDERLQRDDGDLTPPHGDDLRAEETFGRTDRYSNLDDEAADREKNLNRLDDRASNDARMDVRRREHSAD